MSKYKEEKDCVKRVISSHMDIGKHKYNIQVCQDEIKVLLKHIELEEVSLELSKVNLDEHQKKLESYWSYKE